MQGSGSRVEHSRCLVLVKMFWLVLSPASHLSALYTRFPRYLPHPVCTSSTLTGKHALTISPEGKSSPIIY